MCASRTGQHCSTAQEDADKCERDGGEHMDKQYQLERTLIFSSTDSSHEGLTLDSTESSSGDSL